MNNCGFFVFILYLIVVILHFRCDKDSSAGVSLSEAISCIENQVQGHLSLAIKENFFVFTAVDLNPRNGEISTY